MHEPDVIRDCLHAWYSSLKLHKDKLPAKGTISAALVVLERLRHDFNLSLPSHLAEGGAQISGLSERSLRKVLKRFGENRRLSAIAGRTNRALPSQVGALLNAIRTLELDKCNAAQRDGALEQMQKQIVERYVSLYFKIKRVKAIYNQDAITRDFIGNIVRNAAANGKAGPVAE